MKYTDPTGLIVPLIIPGICAAGGCEAAGAVLASAAAWWAAQHPPAIPSSSSSSSGNSCEEECELQYDRDMGECRLYSKMTGDKYTFVACKREAESRLSKCMSNCGKGCKQ